ncbi:molybdopterin-containing oxidoreductase family protein [Gaetbulibacter aestuarii]|uniref:Molybdopterin-dependent oxidoreductase n=1 Tax=Gaetbulibacter aestuarii TaxID=1502358 RepID=A0ABW7MV98_9FLAO
MDSKKNKTLDRRAFMELSALGAAGISLASMPVLSACSSKDNSKTVWGACYHDCPDRCSWSVTTVNGKITNFQANNDAFTAGKLCDKMETFPEDVTFHPDRILYPLKRNGPKGSGQFEKISWEQGIREVAEKLHTIIAEKGGEAVLPYSYAGNMGLVQSHAISGRFFARIGASQRDGTMCGSIAATGVSATNGQTTGVLPEDIVHSRYIVLWGTNTKHSNQHLWPFIEKARNAGAKVIVVDPFQSKTAEDADWHIQPKPGTDVALALGLMHVILKENLQDQDYIDNYTSGFNELKAHVADYDPKTVATITGLEEESIITFAKDYALSAQAPSLIRVLIGMEHQSNGGGAFRSIAMLPSLTGSWRYFGGGLMHMTYELFGSALNWKAVDLPKELQQQNTRSINMVELGKVLTDTELEPGIHALFVHSSNPMTTTMDQNLIKKGLERDDLLTVVSEHFLTDTARYADYVFPATTVLENWDVLDSWGTAYININEPAIAPIGEAKPNSELYRLLAKAMGFTDSYFDDTDLDMVKKTVTSQHPYMAGITFESLRKNGGQRLKLPEKWMPHAEGNFGTKSGKCLFYDLSLKQPLPDYIPLAISEDDLKNYPFKLLSIKKSKNFLNSSHANVVRNLKTAAYHLDIHPEDAKTLQISNGDQLKVFNQKGRVLIPAQISKKVTPGVVCMPQGFWASLTEGGSSANALTSAKLADMGGGPAIQETRVNIQKV